MQRTVLPVVGADEDDDLVRLALAGDPDAPLPDDAVPLDAAAMSGRPDSSDGILPSWYMPAPAVDGTGARQLRGWRRRVAWGLVIACLAVTASGLCNTYGILEIA